MENKKEKKKVKHKESIISFIIKNRALITLVLILFITGLIICPFIIQKTIPIVNYTESRIEVSEHVSQILASLFVAIGSFIAVFQYYISSRSEMIKLEKEKITKAIDLAGFYKDNILTPYSILRTLYKEVGIFDLLKKEKNKMKDFDENELTEIFSDKEIANLKKIYTSKVFLDAIVRINETYGLNLNGFETELILTGDSNTRKKSISVDTDKALSDFYTKYISGLLNNMELFSMYFTHCVADESVVYQSLYPTYIEMCQALYYDISKCSSKGGPKLYRNVQMLYMQWNAKAKSANTKVSDTIVNMGTISENLQ